VLVVVHPRDERQRRRRGDRPAVPAVDDQQERGRDERSGPAARGVAWQHQNGRSRRA
jgi:hypothetical protein